MLRYVSLMYPLCNQKCFMYFISIMIWLYHTPNGSPDDLATFRAFITGHVVFTILLAPSSLGQSRIRATRRMQAGRGRPVAKKASGLFPTHRSSLVSSPGTGWSVPFLVHSRNAKCIEESRRANYISN